MTWLLATIPLMVLASVIAIGPLFFQMLEERSLEPKERFGAWSPSLRGDSLGGGTTLPTATELPSRATSPS